MPNTRAFCDLEGNEHALVPAIVEVRDSIGNLAVQVLSARENLAEMDYSTMIQKLYEIVCDLQDAYDDERTRIPYL